VRIKGRYFFSFFLIAVGVYAAHSALGWKFKTALFPLSTGIPLIVLASAQLLWDLFGKAEKAGGPSVDLEFTTNAAPAAARRRATILFLWIVGFIALVFLVGFPIAVPLFMLAYLSLQSRVGLWQSVGLTAAAWGFFHVVFERVIRLQFEAGVIQSWLGL